LEQATKHKGNIIIREEKLPRLLSLTDRRKSKLEKDIQEIKTAQKKSAQAD